MSAQAALPIDDDLPTGWVTAPLVEVTEINPKGGFEAVDGETILSFVPMAAVPEETGRIDLSVERAFAEVSKGYTRFREGDVIFAKITPCMENGKIAVARRLKNGLGCGSTEFHVLRTPAGISPDYIRYFLVQRAFRSEAERSMQGAVGHKRVPAAFLGNSRLPLAPANEQQRIVEEIDELFSQIEAGEHALERAQKLLERYRQSVLNAAVTGELTSDWREQHKGKLESGEALLKGILQARREAWEQAELAKMHAHGKPPTDDRWKQRYKKPEPPDTTDLPVLPEGWVWSSLGQLFEVSVGATPSRARPSYWNGDIPWVSSGEVRFTRIHATREQITEEGMRNSSTRINPRGTVLLAMIGEGKTRGQAAILEVDACNNQNAAAILVAKTPIAPEYIFYFLLWRYEETRKMSSGGNQPALNSERVRSIQIPLPGLDELRTIANLLEERFSILGASQRVAAAEKSRCDSLQQSILQVAFSGKLVPQDPADEPASVLLGRIAAERKATDRPTPRRARRGERAGEQLELLA